MGTAVGAGGNGLPVPGPPPQAAMPLPGEAGCLFDHAPHGEAGHIPNNRTPQKLLSLAWPESSAGQWEPSPQLGFPWQEASGMGFQRSERMSREKRFSGLPWLPPPSLFPGATCTRRGHRPGALADPMRAGDLHSAGFPDPMTLVPPGGPCRFGQIPSIW